MEAKMQEGSEIQTEDWSDKIKPLFKEETRKALFDGVVHKQMYYVYEDETKNRYVIGIGKRCKTETPTDQELREFAAKVDEAAADGATGSLAGPLGLRLNGFQPNPDGIAAKMGIQAVPPSYLLLQYTYVSKALYEGKYTAKSQEENI
jgi:hypothetical protein